MNRYTKILAVSALVGTAPYAMAAGSPGVERHTQHFLEALAASGGKPLEQLSPAEARGVLVHAQAGVDLTTLKVNLTEKIIKANGHPIMLTVVRPADTVGRLPVFMFFHGGGWVLGDFPTRRWSARSRCCRWAWDTWMASPTTTSVTARPRSLLPWMCSTAR
jgi:acetyl esterase